MNGLIPREPEEINENFIQVLIQTWVTVTESIVKGSLSCEVPDGMTQDQMTVSSQILLRLPGEEEILPQERSINFCLHFSLPASLLDFRLGPQLSEPIP